MSNIKKYNDFENINESRETEEFRNAFKGKSWVDQYAYKGDPDATRDYMKEKDGLVEIILDDSLDTEELQEMADLAKKYKMYLHIPENSEKMTLCWDVDDKRDY